MLTQIWQNFVSRSKCISATAPKAVGPPPLRPPPSRPRQPWDEQLLYQLACFIQLHTFTYFATAYCLVLTVYLMYRTLLHLTRTSPRLPVQDPEINCTALHCTALHCTILYTGTICEKAEGVSWWIESLGKSQGENQRGLSHRGFYPLDFLRNSIHHNTSCPSAKSRKTLSVLLSLYAGLPLKSQVHISADSRNTIFELFWPESPSNFRGKF